MTLRGGRSLRLGALVGALVLTAAMQLAPASKVKAAEPVPVTGGSWYWQPQIAAINTPAGPVASPAGPLPTPDVPAGDFAVTAILGQANKETYLHLDATAIPKGSTVQQLTLTLKEDSAGLNLLANTAKVAAYPIISFFTDGAAAGVWDQRPSFNANVKGAGTRAADGTWKFDLTPLASKWADGSLDDNGIALVADAPAAPETWQVVWSGTAPRPSVEGLIIRPAAPSEGASAPAETSGAAGGEQASAAPAGAETSTVLPSVAPSSFATPSARSVTSAPLETARLQLYRPAVVREGKPKRAPPWTFYAAAVAIVAVLLLGGVALGDRGDPPLERRGSVLRTLERRNESSATEENA